MHTPDTPTPQQLRDLIESAGISQQEAARRLHVDPSTLRRWLSGARSVPWLAYRCLQHELPRA